MLKKKIVLLLIGILLLTGLVPCSNTFAQTNELKKQRAVKNGSIEFSELNQLSDSELITFLCSLDRNTPVTNLFQYSQDAYKFYSNTSRMNLLLEEIKKRGSSYTDSDDLGVPVLMEVVRAGYYLSFYHDQLSFLNEKSERKKCIACLEAVIFNPAFDLGTDIQDNIVDKAALFASTTYVDAAIVSRFGQPIQSYADNINEYKKSFLKASAIYDVMSSVGYSTNHMLYKSEKERKASPLYGAIDDFVHPILQLSNAALDSSTQNIISNALYYLSYYSDYMISEDEVNKVLTNAMEIYPYMGYEYFQAEAVIDKEFQGVNSHGEKINHDELMKNADKHYFPNTYTFDDGAMVIRAGSEVTYEKIQKLYWASKEVRAQFFRCFGSDIPLEKNHKDDTLEIFIFNSLDEYKVNSFLHGVSTNNGGIYMEGDGRFYTYERTKKESIFSLEELFRHEYTHYLQGRYLVPGLWGESDIYQNERMTWFEEGGAEFFAGATRTEGIKPRKSIINYLSPSSSSRYSLGDTIHSTYNSGFQFYNYASVLTDYLYNKEFSSFMELADIIRNNRREDYDNYRSSLEQSAEKNKNFENHMKNLYDNRDSLGTPLVSDDYLLVNETFPKNELYQTICKTAKLTESKFFASKSNNVDAFTISGIYTGTTSQGYESDWIKMNEELDQMLKDLSNNDWNGYRTLTAYFVNYRLTDDNNYQFDLVFSGAASDGKGNNLLFENNTIKDTESNDTLDSAQKITTDCVINGKFEKEDNLDYYQVEIPEDGILSITSNKIKHGEMSWILCPIEDKTNYLNYYKGDEKPVETKLDKGTYIIIVYRFTKNDGDYEIAVNYKNHNS